LVRGDIREILTEYLELGGWAELDLIAKIDALKNSTDLVEAVGPSAQDG
jgi:hypothetical protein